MQWTSMILGSIFVGALLMTGCATSAPVSSPPTKILVAVRMSGGGTPSTEQAARVHEAIAPVVTRAGLELALSLAEADYLVTVTITPDSLDEKKARFVVTSVEPKRERRDSANDLSAARASIGEVERWGQSRSAPIYP
jgi:hypothetical protein